MLTSGFLSTVMTLRKVTVSVITSTKCHKSSSWWEIAQYTVPDKSIVRPRCLAQVSVHELTYMVITSLK